MSSAQTAAIVPGIDAERRAIPELRSTPPAPRRGFSVVPFFGDLVAMARLLRDRRASGWAKLLAFAAIAYVVCPVDLLPDFVAPLIAWIDDVGVVLALRLFLHRHLLPYRYPLFSEPTPVVDVRVVAP